MALENGFYRAAGLDVEILPGGGALPEPSGLNGRDQLLVQQVLDGQADFSVTSSGAVLEFARGKPVAALAAIMQSSPGVFMVRTDSGIHNLLDLQGKKILLSESSEALALLQKEGLDAKQIIMMPEKESMALQALIDGKADAYFGYISNEAYQLRQLGVPYSLIRPQDYGVDFYNDVLVTSLYLAKHNPALVEAFLQASLQGWRYALEHVEETSRLIHERYAPDKSIEALMFEAEQLRKLIKPDFVAIGHMSEERWRRIAASYAELGMLPADVDVHDFLYLPPAAQDNQKLYLGLAGLSALIAVIFAISAYIYRINLRLAKLTSLQQATLNCCNDAILAVDLQDRWLLYNQQFLRMWAVDAEMAAAGDDRQALAYAMQQMAEPKAFISKVLELKAKPNISSFDILHLKDGRVVERASAPQYVNSQVAGRVWSFRDITSQENYLKQLQESRRHYQDIVESAMDAIITINAQQRITLFNSGAERMFCCSAEYALNLPVETFIPEQFRRDHHHQVEMFGLEQASSFRMKSRRAAYGLRANGLTFPIEVSIAHSGEGANKIYTAIIRDTSERIEAEQQLQASQKENQIFADLMRFSSQPIAIVNANGKFSMFNAAYEALTGYAADELMHLSCMIDLTPPEWREFERAKFQEISETGRSVRYEKEYIRKDGSRIPVELLLNMQTAADGKPLMYYAFVMDISERKRAEAERLRNEKRMKLATAASRVGIWERNLSDNTLTWDAQMFRIYGVHPTADLRFDYAAWSQFVLAEDWPKLQAKVERVIADRRDAAGEFRIRRQSDGEIRFIEVVYNVVINPSGQVEAMVGTNRDITEFKQVEISLRENLERWRFALEAGQMAAWETNLLTGQEWRSEMHSRIFGYVVAPSFWSFQIFLQHVVEEDREEVAKIQSDCLKNIQDCCFECRIRRVDGEIRWLSIKSKHLRQADGGLERVIGLINDITEQKQIEMSLRDADRQKDDFLAMLAHELRNPLAPIKNAAEILKQFGTEDCIPHCADIIDRQLHHLMIMIDDLLDISRINKGLITLKKQRLEIRDVVASAVESCQELIAQRQHHFSQYLPDQAIWLEGDPIRLTQAFSNLLNNAAKYTPPGGHIRLIVEANPDSVCVRVRDDGRGIAADDLPKLFELFYQTSRGLDRTDGGLGLGLTIVKQLVEKHHGTVKAYSAGLGKGSEFVIRLPRLALTRGAPTPVQPLPPPEPKLAASEKLKILIVEDNQDVADSLALLLDMDGNQPSVAYNGADALAYVENNTPDAIILDIGLPGMNGYELAGKLRARPELESVLLIAMSGYGRDEDRQKALQAGINEFMVKPADFKQLQKLLAEYRPRGDSL